MRRLTRLGLSHNKLTSVPPEIHRLIRVEELDFDHNHLTDSGVSKVTWTKLSPSLRFLGLSFNMLSKIPSKIEVELTELLVLRIEGNPAASPSRPRRRPRAAAHPTCCQSDASAPWETPPPPSCTRKAHARALHSDSRAVPL